MFIKNYSCDAFSDRSCMLVNLTLDMTNEYDRARIMRLASTGTGVHIINDSDYDRLTHPSSFVRATDLKVTKIIYHNPATIVFWSDGTKTVVVCDKKDKYDPEKGFYIACAKKLFGNNYRAVGRMNKALELAVDVTKKDK